MSNATGCGETSCRPFLLIKQRYSSKILLTIGGHHLNPENLIASSRDLQKAFDAKELDKVLEFYHPDIVLISPSSGSPVVGIEELRKAVSRQFEGPQRTSVSIKEINAYPITGDVAAVFSEIKGYQSIYLSSYEFKGLMTRIFMDTEKGPKIIIEHFSLLTA